MSSRITSAWFLSGDLDRPSGPESGDPTCVAICTVPRSGSNRLAAALFDLGIGVPGEYFLPDFIPVLARRWHVEADPAQARGFDAYWRKIRELRTRNGMVCCVFFRHQMEILGRLPIPAGRKAVIHLHRRDTASQVASLLALFESKAPYDSGHKIGHIPDIGEISARAVRIVGKAVTNEKRKLALQMAGQACVSVAMEDLVTEPERELRRILSHLGLAVDQAALARAVGHVRQSGPYRFGRARKQAILADFAEEFSLLGQD